MDYFAHSLTDPPRPITDWERLGEHLRAVARGARRRAEDAAPRATALADAAEAAGLLHDLGKYRAEFQRYIRGQPPLGEKSHAQAGAARAFGAKDYPVAFAVAGHHAGLHDRTALADLVRSPSGASVAAAVWGAATTDCPELAACAPHPPARGGDPLAWELFTRLVFSCLVDADWTATGAFYRRARGLPAEPDPPPLAPADRLAAVLAFVAARAEQVGDTPVGTVRADVLAACLAAAGRPPGAFTLTVPTSGKTLSGLAFALKHKETRP